MVDSGAMAAAQVNSTTPSLHRNCDPHYADLRPQPPTLPSPSPPPSPLTHHPSRRPLTTTTTSSSSTTTYPSHPRKGAGKLAARAEGRSSRAPGWRDPLRGGVMDTNGLEELEVSAEPDAAVPPSEASPLGQELGWDILSSLYPEDDFDD